jgi:M6 family metalloprotease-like protein
VARRRARHRRLSRVVTGRSGEGRARRSESTAGRRPFRNGYIFLDYRQNQQYDSTRVTAHETGHVLGLPDHYQGPCSELMSGGGPGPSCTNAVPNATERSRVNRLWANGLAAAMDKALEKSAR